MSKWIKAQLPTSTEDQLQVIANDAEKRINSRSEGGCHQPEYIHRQQSIVDAVQNELGRRKV